MSTKFNDPVVVTIDIGSGSCRALAWDANGNTVATAQKEWEFAPSGHPGGLVFNTDFGWDFIAECVREILTDTVDPQAVKGVTATSVREGFVLYDKSGKAIWAVPNVDARAQAQAESLLKKGYGETFYNEAGDWTSLAASARLMWVKENEPEIWKEAAHFGMLNDWVLQKLSGKFVSDPTTASSSAMMNIRERTWSNKITEILGVSHIMPPIVESAQIIGEVTSAAAEKTLLPVGTPVITSGADTQMAYLGGGVTKNGQLGIAGGTFWLTAGIEETPVLDPKMELRTLCHAIPGQWMIEGCGFSHGMATRWVRDQLMRASNRKLRGSEAFDKLFSMASKVPVGSNGVKYFSSAVMNTRSWKHPSPTITGVGTSGDTDTGIGAIFRAVLESTCYVTRGHVEMIEIAVGHKYEKATFLGGPSRSNLWAQMLADILGIRVEVPDVLEDTCMGAALCAWTGLGRYNSIDEASKNTMKMKRLYEPHPVEVSQYNHYYRVWRELCDYQLGAADKGLTEYMWVGAGARSPESIKAIN